MELARAVSGHRRDVPRRHLGVRPRGSHPLREPCPRAACSGSTRREMLRPHGLRLPRRGGRGQFAAHLDDLRAGELNQATSSASSSGATARRCGSWSARARCAAPTAHHRRSCTGSATTATVAASLDEPDQQPAPARRGAADRPDRQLGVGRRRATRSPGPRGSTRSTGSTPTPSPRTYADFLDIVHPDDRAAVDDGRAGRPSTTPSEFMFVARVQASDDDWVWTRGRGRGPPRRRRRGSCACRGTHQDVTETKLAEMALEDSVAPERPDAGGRHRRQRGAHPGGGARPGAGTWCCSTTTGSAAARSCPRRTGTASYLSTSSTRTARPTPPSRRRPRPSWSWPTGPSASGATVWDDSRLTIAFPCLVRRRGLRGRHDHLGTPALPPRHDPVDGRAGGRPARPGRRARARRARAGRPRATRPWRPRGRSRSSWPR